MPITNKTPASWHVECVRHLDLVQRALRRDMRRQHLSMRKVARISGIALSSLSRILDIDRVYSSGAQPKRGFNRATLMQLRAMPWLGDLSAYLLDCILRRSTKRYRS